MTRRAPATARPSLRLALRTAAALGLAAASLFACDDEAGDPPTTPDVSDSGDVGGDSDAPAGPDAFGFRFGVDARQTVSAAPFPNDLYLVGGEPGLVTLAGLDEDPELSALLTPSHLATWGEVAATRTGFGVSGTVLLFVDGDVDLATVDAEAVAVDGLDAGHRVALEAYRFEAAHVLGLQPPWGQSFRPDTTYVVTVAAGVAATDGSAFEAPEGFVAALTDEQAAGPDAWAAFAPMRQWLSDEGASPGDLTVGTVFTTQPVLAWGQAIFEAAGAVAVEAPTRDVRYDAEAGAWVTAEVVTGEGLAALMGTPEPFEGAPLPGSWYPGGRQDFAALGGGPYDGGTFHGDLGAVANGSIVVPTFNMAVDGETITNVAFDWQDGAPAQTARTALPFTLYLCADHVADPSDVPVALFSHGGGAQRHDAVAIANLACAQGIATLAVDMYGHGGRGKLVALDTPDGPLIAPAALDLRNDYTGTVEGDEGHTPDHVAETASAASAVGAMYAVPTLLHPDVVETNLFHIPLDTYGVLRAVREADWSGVIDGLSFDAARVFHTSLSFGTTFHTPLMALADFRGILSSVGTAGVLWQNIAVAPTNAIEGSGLGVALLGLKITPAELQTLGLKHPALGLHQWLHERGDSLPWATHVMRHRAGGGTVAHLSSGNSWDHTLHAGMQLTYLEALGVPAYAYGDAWTVDPTSLGASGLAAAPHAPEDGALSANVTLDGREHTAAAWLYASSCHAELVTNVCALRAELAYPPATSLDTPAVAASPICALHAQAQGFLASLMADEGAPAIDAPSGTCAEVYGALGD